MKGSWMPCLGGGGEDLGMSQRQGIQLCMNNLSLA
jgi:hypothetical protein